MKFLKKFIDLLFIKIIPVKKNRIVFMSYGSQFNDSPRVFYEEFKKANKDCELIWLVNKKNNTTINGDKFININSIKGKYYYGSANIIIDNNYGGKSAFLKSNKISDIIKYKLENFLKYKKNQYIYTFWHGTPLKKMARDQIGENIIDFKCKNTTMILGNKYTIDIMNHICFDKVKMKLLGSPRNDVLFNIDNKLMEEKKEKLGLPLDKKIILYAPTFRSDKNKKDNIERSGIIQLQTIDFEKLFVSLTKKFGGEWIFVCRFHQHVSTKIDWEELTKKYKDKIKSGNKDDDIRNYMICADAMITDVSSCIFDFMHTNRPSFLYFPDLEYYKKEERGLYYSIEKLPFSIATTSDALIDNIENFNSNEFKINVNKLKKEFGYVDNPNSAKEIIEYIKKDRDLK